LRGAGVPKIESGRRSESERQSLSAILNLVRLGLANTRQEIEKQLNLGRAVVADRLTTLGRLGLIDESELGPATGGRAPRLVRFRADAGLVLVAFLDQSTLGVGIADLSGRLLFEHHEAADVSLGPAATLKRLATLFDWVLDQHQNQRAVWGIGVAVPGPVEAPKGETLAWPTLHFLPNWDAYPVVENLLARHEVPVWLRSNVQMMTVGEMRAGRGIGEENFLFVKYGKSISAGLVSGGRFHRGAQGGAGLIGHISIGEDSTVVCRCGNTGCLEAVVGEEAIVREGLRAAKDGRSRYLADAFAANGDIGAADVGLAAQLGDAFSAELLARCGRQIGTTLAALTNSFNPSLIVLSGGIPHADDILLATIREAVYRHSHPLTTRDLRIVRSQMGNSAGLVGSAMAVVEDLFSKTSLDRWIAFGSPIRDPEFAELVSRARAAANQSQAPAPPGENRLRAAGGRT
jgi:predicted NBD/HSP70 family sugar kinase